MPETDVVETETVETETVIAPETDAFTPPAPPPAQQPPADDFDKARAMETINKLREIERQAKIDKKRLQELETLEAKRAEEARKSKEAEMSELEKLQAQLDEQRKAAEEAAAEREKIRAEADAKALETAVLLKAAEMGFEHPRDALKLVDLSAVEKAENGDYTGIEDVLKPLSGRLPMKRNAPKITATQPGEQGTQGETLEQMKARLFGNDTRDMFDPRQATKSGGGILWSENPES